MIVTLAVVIMALVAVFDRHGDISTPTPEDDDTPGQQGSFLDPR